MKISAKARCEQNQFGRGMNATLFGNEISRRFEKKTNNIGRMYQGIGILTTGEGLVKGLDSLAKFHKGPLEANRDTYQTQEGEGCEGLHKVRPPKRKKGASIGKNHEKPFTPFTSSSIENRHRAPSEGDAGYHHKEKQPFTNPSPKTPLPEGWEEFTL